MMSILDKDQLASLATEPADASIQFKAPPAGPHYAITNILTADQLDILIAEADRIPEEEPPVTATKSPDLALTSVIDRNQLSKISDNFPDSLIFARIGDITKNSMIMNSGCLYHSFNDKKWFSVIKKLTNPIIYQIANGTTASSKSIKATSLPFIKPNGKPFQLNFSKVFYSPYASCNLIFLGQLNLNGIWYYGKRQAIMSFNDFPVLRAGSRRQASLRKTDAVDVRENPSSGPAKSGKPFREWIRIHSSRFFPSRFTRFCNCFSFFFY
jgi:hypothetical protein